MIVHVTVKLAAIDVGEILLEVKTSKHQNINRSRYDVPYYAIALVSYTIALHNLTLPGFDAVMQIVPLH